MSKRAQSKPDQGDPRSLPLQGQRLVRPILHLIEKLHPHGTERDTARNRLFFCDQYVTLLLMYFFNPILTSLRGLLESTQWKKVRSRLGITSVSAGSFSEASGVFDPEVLKPIIHHLADQISPSVKGLEAEALRGLTAVDGSFFSALPRMIWAFCKTGHYAVKLHLHFDVFKGVPVEATVTHGKDSERKELAETLQSNRIYVLDRGYVSYELYAKIITAGSSVIGRVQDNVAYETEVENPLSEADKKAGVIRDLILSRLGSDHHKDHLKRPMRLVIVRTLDRNGKPNDIPLITDRLDLSAELIALAYRYRWLVELFFRWFKCVLGTRHLISQKLSGITWQLYAAVIVTLLLALRAGVQPNKRILELVQFYLLGLIDDDEFDASLEKHRRRQSEKKRV